MKTFQKGFFGVLVLALLALAGFALFNPAVAQVLDPGCTVNSDCKPGFECKEAACVEKEEEPPAEP